jgi:RNA polymerase sigma-70 factor, ECF subfamily
MTSAIQDRLYEDAVAAHGPALARLARSYELDPDKRSDLLQEIHFALWRSLSGFAGDCSLRTWIYRVAHNVGATHIVKSRRLRSRGFVGLEDIAETASPADTEAEVGRQRAVEQLYGLVHQLHPVERQVILLYLEGFDGAAIAEVTGLSAGNVATKIHRIKKILASRFHHGDTR